MSDLLEGLEGLGLDKLKPEDLYSEKGTKKPKQIKKTVEMPKEDFYIFDKTYTCPNCDEEFKNKTVKNGKAKLIGTDVDLRPRHEGIDMSKYEVIVCPICGYAALTRYFDYISVKQSKMIKEKISNAFRGVTYKDPIFSYKEALERYKLALANAIVKQARASEKAYICLRTAWLLRGMGEDLSITEEKYEERLKEIQQKEMDYLVNSLEGFKKARSEENYPMCGMDEVTIDYIIAALAMKVGQLELSSKLISEILMNSSSNARMKERVRALKELVIAELEERKKKNA